MQLGAQLHATRSRTSQVRISFSFPENAASKLWIGEATRRQWSGNNFFTTAQKM